MTSAISPELHFFFSESNATPLRGFLGTKNKKTSSQPYNKMLLYSCLDLRTYKNEQVHFEISNAIEVLEQNGHVVDSPTYYKGVCTERKISITHKGAIDFRKNFYLKQIESEEIESIKNTVVRIE